MQYPHPSYPSSDGFYSQQPSSTPDYGNNPNNNPYYSQPAAAAAAAAAAPSGGGWNQADARSRPIATQPLQQPQQPYYPPTQSVQQNAVFNPDQLLANPVAGFVYNYSKDHFGKNLSGVLSFLSGLRYYFHVSNSYVLRKIKILLFPFLHSDWKRQPLETPGMPMGGDSVDSMIPPSQVLYKLPKDDVNAPDLYIPTMSFVTLTLLMGYGYGLKNSFHPELLGMIASKTLVTLFLEVVIIKAGFYLVASATTPKLLDLTAYSSYKYVNLIVTVFLGILFGPWVFYSSIFVFGVFSGLFMMRVMKRVCSPIIDHDGLAGGMGGDGGGSRTKSFLLSLLAMQIVISWFLVRGVIS